MQRLLLPGVAAALVAGGLVWAAGESSVAARVWMVGTAAVLLAQLVDITAHLRRGEFGVDVIAALAMGGALLLGEHLAGIIVALMFTGGEALEALAYRRARREMTALLGRVPRTAARYAHGELHEVDLEALAPGDRILVRRGEVVPVDGTLTDGVAVRGGGFSSSPWRWRAAHGSRAGMRCGLWRCSSSPRPVRSSSRSR